MNKKYGACPQKGTTFYVHTSTHTGRCMCECGERDNKRCRQTENIFNSFHLQLLKCSTQLSLNFYTHLYIYKNGLLYREKSTVLEQKHFQWKRAELRGFTRQGNQNTATHCKRSRIPVPFRQQFHLIGVSPVHVSSCELTHRGGFQSALNSE